MPTLLSIPDELILRIMEFVGKHFAAAPEKLTLSKEWYWYATEGLFNGQTLVDEEIDQFASITGNSMVKDLAIKRFKRLQIRTTRGTGTFLDLAPIMQLASTADNLTALRFEVTLKSTWYRVPALGITIQEKKNAFLYDLNALLSDIETMSKKIVGLREIIEMPANGTNDLLHDVLGVARTVWAQLREPSNRFRPQDFAEGHAVICTLENLHQAMVRDLYWKPTLVELLSPMNISNLTDLNLDTTGFWRNYDNTTNANADRGHLCPAIAKRLPTLKRLELRLQYICPDVLNVENTKEPLPLEKLVIHLLCFTHAPLRVLGSPGETFTRTRIIDNVAPCSRRHEHQAGFGLEDIVMEHVRKGRMPHAKEVIMWQHSPVGPRVRRIDFLKNQQWIGTAVNHALFMKQRELAEYGMPTRPPVDEMLVPRNIIAPYW